MGIIESLIAALVALAAVAAGFFKAWRSAKEREKRAIVRELQANARLDHNKRMQAVVRQGQHATQEAADKARQAARDGRRDAFEGQ